MDRNVVTREAIEATCERIRPHVRRTHRNRTGRRRLRSPTAVRRFQARITPARRLVRAAAGVGRPVVVPGARMPRVVGAFR